VPGRSGESRCAGSDAARRGGGDGTEPPAGTARWVWFRAREILRREGWRGAAFRVLAALGYRRWGWFSRSLDPPLAPVPTDLPLRFAELGPDQLEAYLAFRRGATREQFLGRLGQGQHCFGAWLEDRLVSVTWVTTGRIRIGPGRVSCALDPRTLYLHDSFSSRDVRGHHVQSALGVHLLERHRAAFARVVSLIAAENRSSVASRRRLGFRRAGTLHHLEIGPLRRTFLGGECPGRAADPPERDPGA
jgi:hypothetical protein